MYVLNPVYERTGGATIAIRRMLFAPLSGAMRVRAYTRRYGRYDDTVIDHIQLARPHAHAL